MKMDEQDAAALAKPGAGIGMIQMTPEIKARIKEAAVAVHALLRETCASPGEGYIVLRELLEIMEKKLWALWQNHAHRRRIREKRWF
jgi:hypothetical protein